MGFNLAFKGLIYFNNKPLHVLSSLAAHHKEDYPDSASSQSM
jgi:hypothetical protein